MIRLWQWTNLQLRTPLGHLPVSWYSLQKTTAPDMPIAPSRASSLSSMDMFSESSTCSTFCRLAPLLVITSFMTAIFLDFLAYESSILDMIDGLFFRAFLRDSDFSVSSASSGSPRRCSILLVSVSSQIPRFSPAGLSSAFFCSGGFGVNTFSGGTSYLAQLMHRNITATTSTSFA